jgi:hypothetical protein
MVMHPCKTYYERWMLRFRVGGARRCRQPRPARVPPRRFDTIIHPHEFVPWCYDSACFTRSGENGTRLIRTPVAS